MYIGSSGPISLGSHLSPRIPQNRKKQSREIAEKDENLEHIVNEIEIQKITVNAI